MHSHERLLVIILIIRLLTEIWVCVIGNLHALDVHLSAEVD